MLQDVLTTARNETAAGVAGEARSWQATMNAATEFPEAEFLLQVLRRHFHPEPGGESAPRIPAALDWSRFSGLAAAHRVEPLVFRAFQQFPAGVEPSVLAALHAQSQITGFQNLVLTRELVRLVEVFKKAGIDFLPMKGPVLAHQLYGDVSRRQFGDLDVLVRPRQLKEARRVLAADGYLYKEPWSAWRERAYEHFGHHYGYYHPEKSVHLEVHWRVMPRNVKFTIEADAFWKRTQRRVIGGGCIPCSPPEDLLLMLTAHGCRHRWERLGWVCDIAALLNASPELDWAVVERRARELGAVRMLDLGLLVARDLLGARLPASVEERIAADQRTAELGADVRAMLFADIDFEADIATRWRYFLRLRERLPHQLSYVVGQTVNSLFWRAISWGQAGRD